MNPESMAHNPELIHAPETELQQAEHELHVTPEEHARLKARVAKLEAKLKNKETKEESYLRRLPELERLAYFDSKTGLLNLNGLYLELERKNLGREKPAKGSMLVLDIDNFKIVNDAYSHSVGDEILKAVADYLKSCVRSTDKVVRWGGEEFVIVFDKTDTAGILQKFHIKKEGEEIGRARINVPVTIEGKEVIITLSGGVTDFSLDEDPDEVFKRADEGLYQAKEIGKDRIIGAQEKKA